MFDRTDLLGLPTWAVLVIVLVVVIGLCDIVNNITKVWRKPDLEVDRELLKKWASLTLGSNSNG